MLGYRLFRLDSCLMLIQRLFNQVFGRRVVEIDRHVDPHLFEYLQHLLSSRLRKAAPHIVHCHSEIVPVISQDPHQPFMYVR